jgi:hypothetical protein
MGQWWQVLYDYGRHLVVGDHTLKLFQGREGISTIETAKRQHGA